MNGFLIVSFGTSLEKLLESSINKLENCIKKKFNTKNVYIAFTSNKIIEILNKKSIDIFNLNQAFEKMIKDKIKNVFILSTHILDGEEYNKIIEISTQYNKYFEKIKISKPLLNNENDLLKCAFIINSKFNILEREALILLGHGTKSKSNDMYLKLESILKQYNKNIYMFLIKDLKENNVILEKINKNKYDKVILVPFMFFCGNHIKNDILGNFEYSLKNILLNKGILFECFLKGLGEDIDIQNLYINHLEQILK